VAATFGGEEELLYDSHSLGKLQLPRCSPTYLDLDHRIRSSKNIPRLQKVIMLPTVEEIKRKACPSDESDGEIEPPAQE
jgi:hypothetical protein